MKFLFERLTQADAGPNTKADFDVKRAVRHNIQRLLANRVAFDADAAPSILNCGLPSIVELSRDSQSTLERYAARIRRMLEYYEPRLKNLRVNIETDTTTASPYRVAITATLETADEIEEMYFPVALRIEG